MVLGYSNVALLAAGLSHRHKQPSRAMMGRPNKARRIGQCTTTMLQIRSHDIGLSRGMQEGSRAENATLAELHVDIREPA